MSAPHTTHWDTQFRALLPRNDFFLAAKPSDLGTLGVVLLLFVVVGGALLELEFFRVVFKSC